MALLEVHGLSTFFHLRSGVVRAVDDVSFEIERGQTVGIVGESGSGKSVTCYSLLRLIHEPGRIEGGQVLFNGEDLLKVSEARMREIRGGKISMIFQDPMTSLNPVLTVGEQLSEAIRAHNPSVREREAFDRVVEVGDVMTIFSSPRHPYTTGLMESIPKLGGGDEWLRPIPGQPPSLISVPPGCAFHPRCFLSNGRQRCRTEVPPLRPIDERDHLSACHFAEELIGATDGVGARSPEGVS